MAFRMFAASCMYCVCGFAFFWMAAAGDELRSNAQRKPCVCSFPKLPPPGCAAELGTRSCRSPAPRLPPPAPTPPPAPLILRPGPAPAEDRAGDEDDVFYVADSDED